MGLVDSLKGIYYAFEDRWYAALDVLDKKIPVYKVIDPIDKVVPSFVLFLLLVLFIVVFLFYVLKFASPYDVTFTVTDAENSATLSGVLLAGTINDEAFSATTDTDGKAIVTVTSIKKNVFESISSIFFDDRIVLFGVISASKTGYAAITKREMDLSKENTLALEKGAINLDDTYPDTYGVRLVDMDSGATIYDSTGAAYVKYKCDNKDIANQPRRITDAADGASDGIFTLNEPKCAFLVTEASAPGYEPSGELTVLPLNQKTYDLQLRKIPEPNEGTARVGLYYTQGDTNVMVSGVRVEFHKDALNDYSFTDASGWTEKALAPGTYYLSVTDENYYPLRLDENITIAIAKGQTTTKLVQITPIRPEDKRIVYFKVVDSVDGNVLPDVQVDLLDVFVDLNNTYVGISGTDTTLYYSGPPTATDANGIYKRTGLSVLSKNVFAVLKKDGYVYKLFKPTVQLLTGLPETVTLEKATSFNSASATATVRSTTGKKLANASAFLYFNGVMNGVTIKNLKLNKTGILTDSNGVARFNDLPAPDYNYAASAYFDTVFSGITSTKKIDANTIVNFDVNINLNVAYLKVSLIDGETGALLTTGDGNIISLNNGQPSATEKIQFTTGTFVSMAYPRTAQLALTVRAPNYIPRTVYAEGLSLGENEYRIKVYPTSFLDGGNVSVFFDDIYSTNNNYWSGVSDANVLIPSGNYKAKFDIVASAPLDYNTLLGMVRLSGPIEITNSLPAPLDPFRKEQYSSDCNTAPQDAVSGVHATSYYLPSLNCHTAVTHMQSGFRWGDANIPLGTYSYVISFTVAPNTDGNKVALDYRAKEVNKTSAAKQSETALKSVPFTVGVPFRQGFYFVITASTGTISVLDHTTSAQKLSLYPQTSNALTVRVYNQSGKALTNGTLRIYSYSGINNYAVPAAGSAGNIYFNSDTTLSTVTLASGINLGGTGGTPNYALTAYPTRFNTSEYLVLVAQFANDPTPYIAYVNTKALGKNLALSAEFLAGSLDQLFDGEVYGALSGEIPTITDARISVNKNCITSDPAANQSYYFVLNKNAGEFSSNYFAKTIPGIYDYQKDCVYVTVYASGEDNAYTPLINQRIMAGSGGSLDPALACVDITISNQTLNSALEPDVILDWDRTELLTIKNNCAKSVSVALDTGVACTYNTSTPCTTPATIAAGNTQIYTVKGRNVDFNPAAPKPNFTDVLGYYPLLVKAKFTENAAKKLALVGRANIHLTNSNQCFAISKDYFDFTQNNGSATIPVTVTDACQYTLIGDYFIPNLQLSAFGYDLTSGPTPVATVSFTPEARVTGNTFTTTATPTQYATWGWTAIAPVNPAKSYQDAGKDYKHYYGLSFDMNESTKYPVDRLQFRFFDINNPKQGINATYGIKIDGAFILDYNEGAPVIVSPHRNFDLNNGVRCTGTQTGNEVCEVGADGTDFIFGLFYIDLPKRAGLERIDFNIIGNADPAYIELNMRAHITLTTTTTTTTISGTSTTVNYALTTTPQSIPAVKNVVYIVKNTSELTGLSQTAYTQFNNPRIYISSNNPEVVTWIEGDALKAMYVGSDYANFNDSTIEGTLAKTFGQSISYGSLNVTDYVSPATANGHTISGVQ